MKIVESLKATCTVVQRCFLGHLKHHHVSGLGAWHDGSTRWCHLLHNLLVVQRTLKLKTDERCFIMNVVGFKNSLAISTSKNDRQYPMPNPRVITHTHHNYIFIHTVSFCWKHFSLPQSTTEPCSSKQPIPPHESTQCPSCPRGIDILWGSFSVSGHPHKPVLNSNSRPFPFPRNAIPRQ